MKRYSILFFMVLALLVLPLKAQTPNYGWSYLSTPQAGSALYSIFFIDSLYGWVEVGSGVKRTTDGGKTWSSTVIDFRNCVFANRKIGWSFDGVFANIYKTNDSGKSWTFLKNLESFDFTNCSAGNERNVCAVGKTGYNNISTPDTIKLINTTDGGATWKETIYGTTNNLNSIYKLFKVQFIDSSHAWLMGRNYNDPTRHYFYWTDDGGRGCQLRDSSKKLFVEGDYEPLLHFIDSVRGWSEQIIESTDISSIFRTTNGGLTWDSLCFISTDFNPDYVQIQFTDTLNGWARGLYNSLNWAIYRTTDGGKSWFREAKGFSSLYAMYFVNNEAGWITDNDKKYKYGYLSEIREHQINGEENFLLYQNYPNPFNPSTTITYELKNSSYVELTVYDIMGRLIKTFQTAAQATGEYNILWDGRNELVYSLPAVSTFTVSKLTQD